LVIEKTKVAAVVVILCASLISVAHPRPRIDFDSLIAALPDLPWDFEIRYVVHDGQNTDMLRIYYDARADVVRWKPDYPGSLASVCHSTIDDKLMRRLLELLREKKFNDLSSDSESVVTVALGGDATISVRVGRTIVRKADRHQRENAALKDIEEFLDGIGTSITADPQSKCDMESVPAKP
jgi:hypothetical protein